MKNSTFPKNSLRNNKHIYILTYSIFYVKEILKFHIIVIFVKKVQVYVKIKAKKMDINKCINCTKKYVKNLLFLCLLPKRYVI